MLFELFQSLLPSAIVLEQIITNIFLGIGFVEWRKIKKPEILFDLSVVTMLVLQAAYTLVCLWYWRDFMVLTLLTLTFFWLLRIVIMLAERIILGPYLRGTHVGEEILKINACAMLGMTPLTFFLLILNMFSMPVLMRVQNPFYQIIATLFMGLVGLYEAHIKVNFFTERQLITDSKKITKLLRLILIPLYLLFAVITSLFVTHYMVLNFSMSGPGPGARQGEFLYLVLTYLFAFVLLFQLAFLAFKLLRSKRH